MKKNKKHLLTILLFLYFGTTFAHQDFWIVKDYGNIKVRIKTGFDYEEIKKVFLFGKLTEKLSSELGYTDQIFLDFNHFYTGDCKPDYFISFDKGNIKDTDGFDDFNEKAILSEKGIVIRQVSREFNSLSTLKLVEYAIQNLKIIKSTQKPIEYNKNYCQWKINTINTNLITDCLNSNISNSILKVSQLKIESSEIKNKEKLSYFLSENKFTLFTTTESKSELITLSNIYDIAYADPKTVLVFDTNNSFYCIEIDKKNVSKKITIINPNDSYRPFKATLSINNKVEIDYRYWNDKRILIYDIENENLIEKKNK